MAYTATSYYYGSDKSFTLDDMKYGFLSGNLINWSGYDFGYQCAFTPQSQLSQLLHKNDIACIKVIVEPYISEGSLMMRLATPSEITAIKLFLLQEGNRFEYMGHEKDKINSALEDQEK